MGMTVQAISSFIFDWCTVNSSCLWSTRSVITIPFDDMKTESCNSKSRHWEKGGAEGPQAFKSTRSRTQVYSYSQAAANTIVFFDFTR